MSNDLSALKTEEARKRIINDFRNLDSIADWMDYINKNAKNPDEVVIYKEYARKALDFDIMRKHVEKLDNKAKKEFAKACIKPEYEKEQKKDKNGNVKKRKTKKGNEVDVMDYKRDENGNRIPIPDTKTVSVIAAKPYFIEKYIPDIQAEKKEKKASKANFVDEWLNLED